MAQLTKEHIITVCPDCDEKIVFTSPPKLGQKTRCDNCWAFLEVISLNPLELGWEDDNLDDSDDDDWDDDDWDDDWGDEDDEVR
jgi:lysine biosynthesis protein LysW